MLKTMFDTIEQAYRGTARSSTLTIDEWLKGQYVRGEITLAQFEKRIEKFIRVEARA